MLNKYYDKIIFVPAGDVNIASSRLRVYNLSMSLHKKGVLIDICHFGIQRVSLNKYKIHKIDSKKIVVIQKRVTAEILQFVDYAKFNGAFIVYDLDDFGIALWGWTQPQLCYAMLNRADLVITDTSWRRNWLLQSNKNLKVEVLYNCVDYSPIAPVRLEFLNNSPLRIIWFGSPLNINMLLKYAKALETLNNIQLIICGASGDLIASIAPKLNLEVIPWNLESFVQVLQSCDLSCLMHDGCLSDRQKSGHKMITSICWGVPALVSNTPEYSRISREINCEDAVFSNPEELLIAIEKYRSEEMRRCYLNKSQTIIWKNYSPLKMAEDFIGILNNNLKERVESTSSSTKTSIDMSKHHFILDFSYILWRFKVEDRKIVFFIKSLLMMTKNVKNILIKLIYSN